MSNEKLKKVEETFAERLTMLRKGRGWTQEDLALRLDVSPGSVGNWEMGPHQPHPKTLSKIGQLFEVDVPFLLHGEREEIVRHGAMREKPPEYGAVNLPNLLREVEDARDALDRIAAQLRKATAKPGAAAALTEIASASYDRKRGDAKNRKETSDAQRVIAKAEGSR
jgi:transcriptional regulator with XRE-family HTH domain